jgi:hypothetical protein
MPNRRHALTQISNALKVHAADLQALTEPGDHDLPMGWTMLLDAIDRIDIAAVASFDKRAAA